MKKILFEHFEQMMSYDVVKNNACIEIEFFLDDFSEYGSCWLGKTINEETHQAVYWYGLTPDGSQSYDFDSLHDFVSAPIFHDKSIKERWDSITLIAIDGCSIDWRLAHYLGSEPGPIRRPARQIE